MEEEFYDQVSIVGKGALEIDDITISALPFAFRDERFDPLDHDPPIPGAVEYRPLTARRKLKPETPQPGVLLLIGAGSAKRIQFIAARIKRAGKLLD